MAESKGSNQFRLILQTRELLELSLLSLSAMERNALCDADQSTSVKKADSDSLQPGTRRRGKIEAVADPAFDISRMHTLLDLRMVLPFALVFVCPAATATGV